MASAPFSQQHLCKSLASLGFFLPRCLLEWQWICNGQQIQQMLPNQSLFQARSTRPASSIRKHQVSIVHEYSWTFKEIHEVWNDNSNTKLVLKGAVLPSATNKIKQIATLYGDYCEVRVVLHWKAKSEETCWPCGAATWKCLPASHVYTGNGLHVSSRWSWTDEVCKKNRATAFAVCRFAERLLHFLPLLATSCKMVCSHWCKSALALCKNCRSHGRSYSFPMLTTANI